MNSIINTAGKKSLLVLAALAAIAAAAQIRPADAEVLQQFRSPTAPNSVFCSGECGTGSCCII